MKQTNGFVVIEICLKNKDCLIDFFVAYCSVIPFYPEFESSPWKVKQIFLTGTSTASNCQSFFTSAMKNLQPGQIPGWIGQCQAGIQGFGAVPQGVMGPSPSATERGWVSNSSAQGPSLTHKTFHCSRGQIFLRPLSSLCFQSCSNSMSGTSHSLWDAAVEFPAHPWDHPSLGSSPALCFEVPVQVGWWHFQELQGQPGCEAFSSRIPSLQEEILHHGAIRNRNPGHVLMNSCWSSPGRVNANAVKCKKRNKKKSLGKLRQSFLFKRKG